MASENVANNKNARHKAKHGAFLEHGELIVSELTDEFSLPKSTTYHLNSKKLKANN